MAKVNGLQGGVSGKLGNTVFRQRYGQTIAAQYQPNVENRRTTSQVDQRAKFKLLTQLSSVLEPVIAIPRQGAVSGRNQFVSINQQYVGTQEIAGVTTAEIKLQEIKLTKGLRQLRSGSATIQRLAGNKADLYVTGFGTLSVATRTERKRVMAVVVAVDNTNPANIPQILAFVEFPEGEETGEFDGDVEITLPSADFEPSAANTAVLLYEVAIPTDTEVSGYQDLVGNVSETGAGAMLSIVQREGFADAIMSETLGVNVSFIES